MNKEQHEKLHEDAREKQRLLKEARWAWILDDNEKYRRVFGDYVNAKYRRAFDDNVDACEKLHNAERAEINYPRIEDL